MRPGRGQAPGLVALALALLPFAARADEPVAPEASAQEPAPAAERGPGSITFDSVAEPAPGGPDAVTFDGVPSVAAEPAPVFSSVATGYLDTRTSLVHVATGGLLPTKDVPSLANVTEGNVQLKLRWAERAFVYADTSFFWQKGGFFYGTDAAGERVRLDGHDVANLRPSVVLSELYGAVQFHEHLRLTVGKQRVVWGPGFAQNPMDLLNPPKDPTDPAFQRAGSWMARLEAPFETWTLSFVGAAKVLRQYGGLPSALLYHPDYPTAEAVDDPSLDARDDEAHFTAAARLYALVADTDVNVVWFLSNLYNDAFEDKHRVGGSASHVFGALELHVESLFQFGSSRLYADAGCAASTTALMGCVTAGTSPAGRTRLDERSFTAKVLAGARWMFEDSGILSLEYSFNGDGYRRDELDAYLGLLANGAALVRTLPPGSPMANLSFLGQGQQDPGSPQKFVFEPLRRHYVFLSYQRPQIRDDFTLSAVLLLSAEDLSGQFAPQLTWSAREWLNLTAGVFAPIPGVESLGGDAAGTRYTEYGLVPSDWRAFVSARAFY